MSQSIERWGEQWGTNRAPQVNNEEAPSIFLDPWLTSKGDPLAALVEHLMVITTPSPTSRTRSLRRDAAERKRFIIGNIAANLAHLTLSPNREPGNALAIATAKTKPTRYDRKDYPQRMLAETVATLEEAGILTRHAYVFKQRTTTVEPTAEFIRLLDWHGVRLQDIGRDAGGETIWLRARVEEERKRRGPPAKRLIPYADTEETIKLRSEVERVSEVLNEAGIAYAGESVGPIALRRVFLLRSHQDPHRFDLNGRLVGGFWQSIKSDRRHLITIGREDIVDLDYSAMFAALAYLKVTGSLPTGDAYAIPGLEEHRDGAKMALLTLLNRTDPLKRLAPELKALLPEDWTAWMLEGAMTDHHRAIAHLFGTDIGVELMNIESRILMAVLLDLADKGIPALPMHDGLNVRRSDRDTALETMRQVSERMLGVALPVKEKTIWRPRGGKIAA